MEYPGAWDRLVAALHTSSGPADLRWRFLCHLGLVRDSGPSAPARFSEIVAEVGAQELKPGPSRTYLVAEELRAAGLTTPAASQPDPFGEKAEVAWQQWRRSQARM